jgi:hypothetical protein
MPYIFLDENLFVGIIGVLILGLLVFRFKRGRKPD